MKVRGLRSPLEGRHTWQGSRDGTNNIFCRERYKRITTKTSRSPRLRTPSQFRGSLSPPPRFLLDTHFTPAAPLTAPAAFFFPSSCRANLLNPTRRCRKHRLHSGRHIASAHPCEPSAGLAPMGSSPASPWHRPPDSHGSNEQKISQAKQNRASLGSSSFNIHIQCAGS